MLDIQFIRKHPKIVEEKAKQKGYDVDIKKLLKLDEQRRGILLRLEDLRAKRNDLAAKLKSGKPTDEQIERGKGIKLQISELEAKLDPVDAAYTLLMRDVPNMPLGSVPVGKSEADNKVVKTVGDKPKFGFKPKNHWDIAEAKGWIDKERAAKVAGSRFAYITGDLVRLQFAIMQMVVNTLTDEDVIKRIVEDNKLKVSPKAFVPVLPPAIVNTVAYEATARLDAEDVTYKLADDEMWLNASAEHSLCNIYMNEIIASDQLPIRLIGYATSFRREAGTYGKDMEGIIRMHQFDKLEMEVFSDDKTGEEEHKFLVAIQEYLMQKLGVPYQVLQKCTADIGRPNAQGVDVEAWLPGQDKYRETHTADYMTDFQARRLRTKYKSGADGSQFVHTNDATAFALGRIMVAIIENYQTKEGNVLVPEVLKPYIGNKEQI